MRRLGRTYRAPPAISVGDDLFGSQIAQKKFFRLTFPKSTTYEESGFLTRSRPIVP